MTAGACTLFLGSAGGKIVNACYSDVWNDERSKTLLRERPELLSNLLVAVTTPMSDVVVEEIVDPNPAAAKVQGLNRDADIAYLQSEVERLQLLVAAYENGRVMRLLKWLQSFF